MPIQDEITNYFSNNIDISNFGGVIAIFVGFIIFSIVFGILLYFILRELKFKYRISFFEDVQGSDDLEPLGKDKGMLVKIGKGGLQVLYLKKRKDYIGAYGKRMGKRHYNYAIGPDGYYYNFTLGSLKDGLNKVNINPTSINMRYQNEALVETIRKRYDKKGFWSQYGQIIVNLIFFMLIALMFYLYFDKLTEVAPSLIRASEALKEAGEALTQAIGGLDSLKGTGGLASG